MNKFLEFLVKKLIKQNNRQDPKNLRVKTPDEDFIPYVCHFDANTILTKNGELLQIIRITGFSSTTVVSELVSLRQAVRQSLASNVLDEDVAFWFNTIRRKKDIRPDGEFDDFLSSEINEAWNEKNNFEDQFVNELYITVIIGGIDTSITNLKSFLRSFSYFTIRNLHHDFLTTAHQKLSNLTAKILGDLQDYGAKMLGIVEWQGALYSQPMRFFGKIVNLYEDRYPLACNDISNELSSHRIAFGDRELQVVGNNNKNFAAIFSLKEYFEVSIEALDRILQLPFEFIITQSFDFSFNKKDLEQIQYQDYILQVSGDEDFRNLNNLANFAHPTEEGIKYGNQQITITIISKSFEDVQNDSKILLEKLSSLGFVAVHEDIFLEHCFWAQLPANFKLLKRQKITNSNLVAGFAALHSFPSGSPVANHWGEAVCVLKTVLDTPYFFNFHDGDLGHTLLYGKENAIKTCLLNFLLLQARRFQNRLIYFDLNNEAKPLIHALNGLYLQADFQENNLKLNPLSFENNQENIEFLNEFFYSLIHFSKENISESEIAAIPKIIDQIVSANITNFSEACQAFKNVETSNIYKKLQVWQSGSLKNIFNSSETLDWQKEIIACDFSEFFTQKAILVPMMLYLLRKIEKSLNGEKTIIVFRQGFDLFANEILAPKLNNFLQKMQKKNAIVIFTSSNFEISKEFFGPELMSNFATKIFMPNNNLASTYQEIFALNQDELDIIKMMQEDSANFLLKQGDDAVIINFDIFELGKILKILAPDDVVLTIFQEILNENPQIEAGEMVAQIIDVLQALEDEEIAAKKEESRQKNIAKIKAREDDF
jgi:type IV secretion system protein VirB4